MSHWLAVWNDIWFYLKWVPGPLMYIGAGIAYDGKDSVESAVFMSLGTLFTILAVNT